MSRLRQNPTFEDMARNLAITLAEKYKEDFPEVIFSVEELGELFYKRIMTPPFEREKVKENDINKI